MQVINERYDPAVPITSVRLHPDNPRSGDIGAIMQSIEANGFYGACLVQESTGYILAGNHRHQAAAHSGATTIPVIYVDVDDLTAKKILIADNRASSLADWNGQALAELLDSIRSEQGDFTGTLYDAEDYERLLNDLTKPLVFDSSKPLPVEKDSDVVRPEVFEAPNATVSGTSGEKKPIVPAGKPGKCDADESPEPEEKPISTLGDLWILGSHRLLCGDSTNRESVSRLMDGHKAGLMNTDPPYGVSYANDQRPNPGVAKPRVANDEFKDEELQRFLENVFSTALTALKPDAAWYLWHAHLTQGFFAAAAAAAAAAQVILHRQIIWVKPVLLLGRGAYHWKHEPCFMGWVQGNRPPDYGLGNGERTQTTVWEVSHITQAERKEFNHSTPKPVGLFDIPIVKHLKSGEVCYEPFCGSGPQIIAAEKHDVRCFAMELEPRFVDVIVRRWQKFTGQSATLDSDGRTFDEIAQARA